MIIIVLAVNGYKKGCVKVLLPIVSGALSLFLVFMLKDWLFAFLFRWAIFQGEHVLTRIVVIILICLAATLVLKWFFGVLKILTKLPLLHGTDKMLGLLLGTAEGFLLVWLILYLIEIQQGICFGIDCNDMIAQNSFLLFLSENNLIAYLMTTLFGTWLF